MPIKLLFLGGGLFLDFFGGGGQVPIIFLLESYSFVHLLPFWELLVWPPRKLLVLKRLFLRNNVKGVSPKALYKYGFLKGYFLKDQKMVH